MEMCVDYFIRTKDVSLIPEDKRAELFNFIFQMTHNLEIIPLEYRTKEMCKIALQIDLRNFKFIPAELLSKKDYLIYFTKTHDINPIPKEYRLEICKAYFQEQINKGKSIFSFIFYIPQEYCQTLIDEYYDKTNDITKIPKEYRTPKQLTI